MSWANTEAIGKFGDRLFIQESFLDKTHTARHCRCSSAPRRASRCRLGSAAKAWPETCPLSTHVCRSPGTISGPRSVLPEPDPNSKPPLSGRLPTSPAARYWNIARQRYLSPVGPMLPRSARLCRPRRSPRPAHPRKTPASRPRNANSRERQVRTGLSAGGGWIRTVSTASTRPRCVHRSSGLEAAIKAYIEPVNVNPRPFVWTKSADDILATIKRFCLATLKTTQTQTLICKTSEIRSLGRLTVIRRPPPCPHL